MSNLSLTAAIPKLIRAVPRSRNFEAVLIFWVAGIYAYALAQVQLAVTEKISTAFMEYWWPPVLGAFGLHYVLRKKAMQADGLLLPLALLINSLGISMIYRLDLAEVIRGGSELYAAKQTWLTFLALAVAAVVIWFVQSHLFLRRYPYLAMAVGILLLLLPAFPFIGRTINGATLWIGIGDFTFQPGEVAKVALAVFFAGYLVSRKDSLAQIGVQVFGIRFPRARDLGPIMLVWFASLAVLVLQRDLGTSILFFGLFLVMLYAATGRGFFAGIGVAMMITGALVASRTVSYVARRFETWLDPLNEANYTAFGGSYQLVQGLFGLAHGGVIGTGLGGGLPQLIPLAESDFILAALGEELGLAGMFALFAIYLLIVYRGLRMGISHPDDFSKLLAVGLSFLMALQLFVIAAGVIGLLPLTGLTTPFLAAGGSSLLANWLIIALLLRISDSGARRVDE